MADTFLRGARGAWRKRGENPLLGGDLGTCFDVSVLQENGLLKMYFSWRDCHSIARTQSADGLRWSAPEICLAPRESPERWESAVNRPCVLRANGKYRMWYTGQADPGKPEGRSCIFCAVSDDGARFSRVRDAPVLTPESPWEKNSVMNPSVLWNEDLGAYEMWYSGGEQYEPDAFGYARSADGIVWKRAGETPVFCANPQNAWENCKVGGCQVMRLDGWYYMFYIGYQNVDYAQIGMARSRDGVRGWQRSPLNPILAPDEGAWDGEACYKPFALPFRGDWWLFYNGRRGHKEQIGAAVQPGGELRFE